MWPPASAIFVSIVTILVSFEPILMFSVRINFKSQFQSNDLPQALKYIKNASKLTSIVAILANIALAGEHIFQMLAQYSLVLPQYSASIATIFASIEQVNTPYVISQNRYHV